MIHHYVRDDLSGDHFSVGENCSGSVLVQLQSEGNQVRLGITPEQALYMAGKLTEFSDKAKESKVRFDVLKAQIENDSAGSNPAM